MMAVAVMVGFFSHLLLDEICSVDLRGARVNKAFGTAIKFWAPSPWTTLGMYAPAELPDLARSSSTGPTTRSAFDPPAPPAIPFHAPGPVSTCDRSPSAGPAVNRARPGS